MTINNEAIQKAADAAESAHGNWGTWEDVGRAALEAAAPIIRAEALEEAAAWLDSAEQVQNIAFDGPSDIGSLSAKYDAALEEPAEWLRARAAAERAKS